jgi:hypothetical protein
MAEWLYLVTKDTLIVIDASPDSPLEEGGFELVVPL